MNDESINYDRDVLYHLNQITLNCENLQLNYNRDRIIIRYAQNTIESLQLIQKLYQFSNNSKLIEMGRTVNKLFESDEDLRKVLIVIENTKRITNPSNVAFLNFTL
jgi:hypothetical protein